MITGSFFAIVQKAPDGCGTGALLHSDVNARNKDGYIY